MPASAATTIPSFAQKVLCEHPATIFYVVILPFYQIIVTRLGLLFFLHYKYLRPHGARNWAAPVGLRFVFFIYAKLNPLNIF